MANVDISELGPQVKFKHPAYNGLIFEITEPSSGYYYEYHGLAFVPSGFSDASAVVVEGTTEWRKPGDTEDFEWDEEVEIIK